MTESWELPTEFDFRAPLRRGFLLVQLELLLARTISSDTFTTSPITTNCCVGEIFEFVVL